MKAVIDTNVLVSGLINPHGSPGRVVDLLRSGVLDVVVDDRILAEYNDVLGREKFRMYFTQQDREDIIEFLRKDAHRTTSKRVVLDMPDPGDIPFLEVALTEDVPLITGNKRHYPKDKRAGCQVLIPAEFLQSYFTAS